MDTNEARNTIQTWKMKQPVESDLWQDKKLIEAFDFAGNTLVLHDNLVNLLKDLKQLKEIPSVVKIIIDKHLGGYL